MMKSCEMREGVIIFMYLRVTVVSNKVNALSSKGKSFHSSSSRVMTLAVKLRDNMFLEMLCNLRQSSR
jgi:hypothetical protein